MIEGAGAEGRLQPGGVVEYTGGSTGVSLALVCTLSHPTHSQERN
jgi:cysteine synthase A